MASENNGGLRSIAWSEIFPWLSLFRVFRLAVGARMLLLAVVGMLATTSGWSLLGVIFQPKVVLSISGGNCPWTDLTKIVPDQPDLLGLSAPHRMAANDAVQNPIVTPWASLSAPLWRGLDRGVSFRELVYLIACGLWGIAVWALFGGAITRMASVKLASDETLSLSAAVRHSLKKWLAYVGAPLFPMLGVVLLVVPLALIGLALRLQVGIFLFGLLWVLLLVGGLTITLLLLGLIFGWPLMWATISTESTDSFDALSRSFAYVFQRPLHYLFYAMVTTVLGGLGWLLVSQLVAGVVYLTYWAVAWGCGTEQIAAIARGDAALGSLGHAGAHVIRFWTDCAKLVAAGYLFSFFWTSASAMYLLLRHGVDATEMDEVALDEEEQAAALPTLAAVAAPVVTSAGGDKVAKGQDEE